MRASFALGVVCIVCAGCDGAPPLDPPRDDGGSPSRVDAYRPRPDPIDGGPLADTCGLEDPAFCETFESPSPGGRGGDLDERVWSFSRYAHLATQFFVRVPARTLTDRLYPAAFCGQPIPGGGIMPGEDVALCDGVGVDGSTSRQLNEVFDDYGGFGFNSMMIRQPFDFTDRTGTIVWDVDAKINPHNVGHGWWTEVWITEDPVPMPYHEAPTVMSFPRRAVGFAFRGFSNCDKSNWETQLEDVIVVDDHRIVHNLRDFEYPEGWESRCIRTADQIMNRFQLRISHDRAELWASDYDNPGELRLRAVATDLDIPFTRGYVHFQHAHYNAGKDGLDGCVEGDDTRCPTSTQTYRWDNIGFDGPRYPVPRAYEVPDNDVSAVAGDGVLTGYYINDGGEHSFELAGVDLTGALSATLNMNFHAAVGQTIEYRFNGGEWRSYTVPDPGAAAGGMLRTLSADVPLSELVQGTNTFGVRLSGSSVPGEDDHESIGNIDLTVEAQ